MSALESIRTGLLALLASAGPAVGLDFDARDPLRVARALEAARGGGSAAAGPALEGFETAPAAARRARARVLAQEAGPEQITAILALTRDPDPLVRADLARSLGRAEWGGAQAAERRAALAELADDADARVRAAGRLGLAELAAADELSRLAALSRGPERRALVAELATRADGRAAALALLPGAGEELVLAARVAAETPAGPAVEALLARIDAGLERGAPDAAAALERHVRRLAQLGLTERALQVLERRPGPEAAELRARLALTRARDPAAALEAARALAALRPAGEREPEGLLRAARAARFELCARLAAGAAPQVEALAAVRARLGAALAARAERSGPAGARAQAALREELAQLELAALVGILAQGASPDAPAALSVARGFHRAALTAHAVLARARLPAADGLDRLLGAEESAIELLLDAEPFTAFGPERQLAARLALGRALAAVAPDELVGFEPALDAGDDARRNDLLAEIVRAELEAAEERHARAAFALERARIERPGGAPSALLQRELEARLALSSAWEDAARLAQGDAGPLRDARSASWLALTTARLLRAAGRGPEARELLGRARAALEASGAAQRWLWGIELVAEIEAATGSSYTDDEEPVKAEVELLRAVERLRALEDLLAERGAPPRALEAVRNQRANALVSLAVNANVRQGRPDRALVHFEEAWKLRQDEFLRVLLACYRARSGRAEEARAALAAVVPGPGTYYNLACAWALLGEPETALHWLGRELAENHAPGAGLERQKAWARKDPDLASLRADPRFAELVRE
ncbi:MAG: hypothetical protein JNK02_12725 [Planctomycetes bacterium]|nr:hypothetical protein [Planctomycetota bacterium]